LLPVAEAAAAVGRSEEYVRRLVRTGRVLGHRSVGRTWLVDLDSLKGVISDGKQERAS
jgi:excisionase family DNA binding protein